MITLDSILQELKDVPAEHLEDLYFIIHSLKSNSKRTGTNKNKILSFAGSFNDMSEKDYAEFSSEIKNTRENLFDRDLSL